MAKSRTDIPFGIYVILAALGGGVLLALKRADRNRKTLQEEIQERVARGLPVPPLENGPSPRSRFVVWLDRLLVSGLGLLACAAVVVYWRFSASRDFDLATVIVAFLFIGVIIIAGQIAISKEWSP